MPAPIQSAADRWRQIHGDPRTGYDRAYDHRRREEGTRSAEIEKLRHCSRWYRLRRLLLLTEPLCRICETAGRVTQAEQIDHVLRAIDVVRERGPGAFYDPENLQPVCVPCHASKSARERAEA